MWKERVAITLRETGVPGVVRRSVRAGLIALRDVADRAQKRLRFVEGAARIPKDVRREVAKNASLRGLHEGKPAVVLGSGPSLRNQDLSALGGAITFGCGSVFRHPQFAKAGLDYYGIMDSGYFENPDINTPFFEELRQALPRAQFFVPAMFHGQVRSHGWLPAERTHYVPLDGDASDLPWKDIDLSFVPATPNSLQFCLVIALYMGCDPVVLLGADHDWLKERCTEEAIADAHWDGKHALHMGSHHARSVHPDYQHLAEYSVRLWQGYKEIQKVATRRGQRIINATPGSFLDVFPTADLAQLWKRR